MISICPSESIPSSRAEILITWYPLLPGDFIAGHWAGFQIFSKQPRKAVCRQSICLTSHIREVVHKPHAAFGHCAKPHDTACFLDCIDDCRPLLATLLSMISFPDIHLVSTIALVWYLGFGRRWHTQAGAVVESS
jgi:hypothetical protein